MRLSHLLLTATVFVATACTRGDGTDNSTSADSTFRVALVTTGSIADQSWNSSAYAGLLAIRDSLGATISNVQTKSPAEYDENFRQYGTQEFDLVIGHGFEYQDAASRIGPQFPNTNYVITSGRVTAPNVAGVAFAFEEASYQAGVIAGMMTTSNILGMIAGQEIPPVKASFIAFERGAKSVNPNVQVLASYIGNWEDVSAGKEQALAQISRGADIIFQNADAAGLGVFQAARERKILVFGSNADQNGVAPDVVIGSVLIDLPKALLQIARDVKAGTFTGRVIDMGVREDIVRFVANPAMMSRIPPRALAVSDSIGMVIRSGSFRELDDVLAGADTAKPIGK
jgi:basic membrane lipoprotein Med (substrate-binding protein (PBP1-ABC) superfamily)